MAKGKATRNSRRTSGSEPRNEKAVTPIRKNRTTRSVFAGSAKGKTGEHAEQVSNVKHMTDDDMEDNDTQDMRTPRKECETNEEREADVMRTQNDEGNGNNNDGRSNTSLGQGDDVECIGPSKVRGNPLEVVQNRCTQMDTALQAGDGIDSISQVDDGVRKPHGGFGTQGNVVPTHNGGRQAQSQRDSVDILGTQQAQQDQEDQGQHGSQQNAIATLATQEEDVVPIHNGERQAQSHPDSVEILGIQQDQADQGGFQDIAMPTDNGGRSTNHSDSRHCGHRTGEEDLVLTQNGVRQSQEEEVGSRRGDDNVLDGSFGRSRAYNPTNDAQEDRMTGQLSNATSAVMKDMSERWNGDAVEAMQNLRQLFVEEMGGLKTAMDEIKQMIVDMHAPNEKAYADMKKSSRFDDMDALMETKLPGFKQIFQRAALSPVLFSQIVRYVVTLFNPSPLDLTLAKTLSKVLTCSTREGKAVYDSDVGRAVKNLRREVVKVCISNAQIDVFKLFKDKACADEEGSKIPKWLNDRTICDMSANFIENGCLRHEQKADRTYTKRLSIISKGGIDANAQEKGEYIANKIYASVMDMFVAGRKSSRVVAFEELVYLFVDWKPYVSKDIDCKSVKMLWKADAKEPELKFTDLPFAYTALSGNTDVDPCNTNRLEEVVQRHAHLQLLVQHEVILKEASAARSDGVNDTSNKKTFSRSISLINVCLRIISAMSNFEKRTKTHQVLKYDKYSIIAAYRLASAMRRVVDVQTKGSIKSKEAIMNDGDDEVGGRNGRAYATNTDLNTAKEVLSLMCTPPDCEMGRVFDRNVNAVSSKLYEDDNDVAVSSVFETPAQVSSASQRSAMESSSIAHNSMDTDLDLS